MAITKVTRTLLSTGIVDNSNATAITIDSSENVGIGTSSPTSYGSGSQGLTINGSGNYQNLNLQVDGTTQFTIYTNGTSGTFINQVTADPMMFYTSDTERMRIDSSGNVGIGTSSPRVTAGVIGLTIGNSTTGGSELVLRENTGNDWRIFNNGYIAFIDDNTERMRIDSSGNVTVGSGANVGSAGTLTVNVGSTSTSGGLQLFCPSSGAHGVNFGDSYSGTSRYSGSIEYNHPSNYMRFFTGAAEAMRIDSSGNLLVGTTNANPAESNVTGASILGGGDGRLLVCVEGNEVAQFNRKTTDGTILIFRQNAVARGSVSISGANTSYNTTSDARLKDVTGEARGIEVINKLNPVSYNWKEDGKADEGLIAQEVLDIVPNAVSGSEEDMYQMDYSKLVVHLVKGMKEQQTIIDDLKTRIETLESA